MAPRRSEIDWPTAYSVAQEVAETEAQPSRSHVANRLGMLKDTFNKRARDDGHADALDAILRGETLPSAPTVNGLVRSAVNDETPAPWKVEDIIRAHGDEPSEVKVIKSSATRYGTADDPMHRLRVDWVRKDELIQPADPSSWTPPPKPKKRRRERYLDAVVISDHHAPHHEPVFHQLFLEYLSDTQPGLIEVNGDLLDFSTISRHREREGEIGSVNECLQAGFEILRDYREVCPDAVIRFKRGNHSERLRHLIIDNARGLHNVTPADETTPALSLERLLHLDKLHIEYIDVEWDQAKTLLSPKLAARHGFSTAKNAGEQILDRLAGSTIQGHDHRAGITLRTEHTNDPDDPINVRMAIQGGCACKIPGGLGYVSGGEPNWQNAFGAFRIWEDNGDFHASLGIYVKGRLLAPNGVRYSA